ncbi:MAG: hypothetical protein JRG73_16370 [Deltaproteobacteria bacterium]|nr:hypothetical protein [Deltaproteobacteria bacterium]
MTHRHQARHFENRLKAAGYYPTYSTQARLDARREHDKIFERTGWDLVGKSCYFWIEIYDEDAGIDEDFGVRFADHAQVPGGGFSQARQERMGEATISVDPTTGLTWRDVCWWMGI